MRLFEIRDLLQAEILCGEEFLDREVKSACASDFMSDALAYVKDQAVLLTGMVNPQVIRTAEMMDVPCVIFVRGKAPDAAMMEMAEERGILLMGTEKTMYLSSGLLYSNGLIGG